MKKTEQASAKKSVKKRTLNLGGKPGQSGAAFNQQDPQRRLGNFTTAGEHSRVGARGGRIIGQTKRKNRTDKKGGK